MIAILWKEIFKLLPCLLSTAGVCGLAFPISLVPVAVAERSPEAECYSQSWDWGSCG